ncbi:hypothetical protein MF271_05020 [Deinococcus sp. KNUC1210]|uniref:hypothetical protein n=1 Tax=Deinococcus sp. KNUC1210 TaxID=2917691 RepID=UPI001EF126A2|nr:hypothetical protein [Deinococcus sp. KNUC1210]ULH15997.1 hypothetical protein MF271_05020 [Deinococcus sp. KNUC1210]
MTAATLSHPSEARHVPNDPNRKRYVGKGRQSTLQLTSTRTEQRDARQYAEQWYSALLYWDVREVKIPYSFHYDDGTGPEMLTAGNNARTPTRYLRTPAGEFTDGEVGTMITEMTRSGTVEAKQLGKMLEKLRYERSRCMATLLREDGTWGRNREAAVRYAVAVLTLAVRLRVQEAERPLVLMRLEQSRLTTLTC